MELRKIGKFIASERKAKDITQEKLAEMLDVSDCAVSKWERGIFNGAFRDACESHTLYEMSKMRQEILAKENY